MNATSTSLHPEDYERIAQAIVFMRQNHLNQPNLVAIAQQVHLSESHFQRLFTQWAGISPKRFLQYLTVEYAKSRIAQTTSLLNLSLDAGLSSAGRLHDLFVNLEAMSPGEFKAGGAGLHIRYGTYPTPFGLAFIGMTHRGICHLSFLDTPDLETAVTALRQTWSQAEMILDSEATQAMGDRIFEANPTGQAKPIPLFVKGTNFQVQVWRALLQLPFGGLTTYQTLAAWIDRPTAARAVGNAVGKNPVAYLIPCHRVIRASGALGGYHWGLERKTALLGWEASRLAQDLEDFML